MAGVSLVMLFLLVSAGIMPPRSALGNRQIWLPAQGFAVPVSLMARVTPGITAQQAAADLDFIFKRLARISSDDYPKRFIVQVMPLAEQTTVSVQLRAHDFSGRCEHAALGRLRQCVLRLIAAGVALGRIAATVLTRFLANQLWHVSPSDPITFSAVIILLFAVGLGACFWPACRAANVDPAIALRFE